LDKVTYEIDVGTVSLSLYLAVLNVEYELTGGR